MVSRQSHQLFEHVDRENELKVIDYFKKALRLNPDHKDAQFELALSFFNVKEYKKSIEEFNKLELKYPGDSKVYNNRGMAYDELDEYSAAIKDYNKSIELNPEDFASYRNLGLLYEQAFFKMDSAILYFEKAAQKAPKNYEVRYSLVIALQLAKRYEESLDQSNIAEQLDNRRSGLYVTRGLTKYYLADYKGAIEDNLFSISMQMPGLYEKHTNSLKYTYNNLAKCYYKVGEITNACTYWQKALTEGYVYRNEWREQYGIEDPVELLKKHCSGK